MTQPKRPLKVFLCHAHADRDAVRTLYTRLTNDGVDAWLDKEKLLGGQNWRMELRAAVEEADVVVVCHSKEFNKEGFRQREVKWALDAAMEKPEGTIFIIPARLEECEVIKSLSDWHWVDLFESNGYDMLIRALRARANNIGATLQIKRSWLPKITSPLPKKQKPVENKAIEISDEKIVNNVDGMPPSPELPDEWEAQWQAAFVKNAKEEAVETTDIKVDKPLAKKSHKSNTTFIVSFIVLVMASIFGLPSLFNNLVEEPSPTQIETAIVLETQTLMPSLTQSIPTSTITPVFTSTPTPLPTEITDAKGVNMMLVPEGEFMMGSIDGNSDESPIHAVYLDAFYIDKYEADIGLYKECVYQNVCNLPKEYLEFYNNNSGDSPIVNITWYDAVAFCEWRNTRLPSEAEWEKSAKGVDQRIYPWGNDFVEVDGSVGNYYEYARFRGSAGFVRVDSYDKGVSPFGIYNLAGNVWEWVADRYDKNYYSSSEYKDPQGPKSGDLRVLRGGSFRDQEFSIRTTYRYKLEPSTQKYSVGFRCAKDAMP